MIPVFLSVATIVAIGWFFVRVHQVRTGSDDHDLKHRVALLAVLEEVRELLAEQRQMIVMLARAQGVDLPDDARKTSSRRPRDRKSQAAS